MSAPSPTLAELLAESIDFPDDVFAPQIDDPDPFGWPDEDPAPRASLAVVPKRTLRDRVACVEFIAETIEQLDDETLTDDARAALSKLLIAELAGTRAKVDAVSAALAMFESLEAAATAERERLDARAKRYARQAERLSDYVLAVLSASNLPKLEGETSTLARRMNPASVVIDDPARLTHEFLAYPEAPPPRPDKAAISKALKAKRAVPGCRLVQTVRLVRS